MLRKASIHVIGKKQHHPQQQHVWKDAQCFKKHYYNTLNHWEKTISAGRSNINSTSNSRQKNIRVTSKNIYDESQQLRVHQSKHGIHTNSKTKSNPYDLQGYNSTATKNHPLGLYSTYLWNNNNCRYSNIMYNRYFSSNSKDNGKGTTGSESTSSTLNKPVNSSNNSGGTKKEPVNMTPIWVGFGVLTVGTSIILLPKAIDQMKLSQLQYNEVEVEDDVYNQMKDISSDVGGEISKRILGEELSQQLADVADGSRAKAVNNTATMVADVLNSTALQNAFTSLISNIISSNQFQTACQMLIKNLWDDLVQDPETVAQVVALLNTAIKDEKIKKSFKDLILGLLNDEEVYNKLTALVVKLGEEREVLEATKELLSESAHRALNDPEILDHSMEFATDVVGDNVLQRTSGEALRNTLTYAVRPSLSQFLSVFGFALIFFSASALSNARASARQGKEIDAAASVVAKSLGNSALTVVAKLFSIPGRALAALGSAVITALTYPFKILGNAGSSVIHKATDIFSKASSFPEFLNEVVSLSLSALKVSLSKGLSSLSSWVASIPEVLLAKSRIWLEVLCEKSKIGAVILVDGLFNTTKSTGTILYSTVLTFLKSIERRLSSSLGPFFKNTLSSEQERFSMAGTKVFETISGLLSLLSALFKATT
mmetsp:Transcript_21860/g.24880  ORF Transcript_21860/g.24880 Transcript_21860/m.24880 type:complete len:657 (-) Transcript_21860:77-2047(-)